MQTVAVTGASGFVGQRLVQKLAASAYQVVALSRRPDDLRVPESVRRRRFDPEGAPSPEAFEGVDAVVHLSGESVAGRWTPQKKRAIYRSRIDGTRCVVQSIARCAQQPGVLLSASASGFYGDRGDEALFETSHGSNDFLGHVCADWEREAKSARDLGLRVACLRTGIVLGAGGALAQMLKPFRLGFGGPFGGGRQFIPWIHIDDLVALYIFALETSIIAGPVNAVTPDYAASARFSQAIGAALRRPALIPAPGFALNALLGEFANSLLASQLMVPAMAEDAGFVWQHPNLESALASIVSPTLMERSQVRRFTCEQIIEAPIKDVFEFFCEPRNLEAITPPLLRFNIAHYPTMLQRGAQIDYNLRLHRLKVGWRTMIAKWKPPNLFVDVQLHGPYALWQHTHTFMPQGTYTKMADEIRYVIPFAPLSAPLGPAIRRDIDNIFAFRRERIQERFSKAGIACKNGPTFQNGS